MRTVTRAALAVATLLGVYVLAGALVATLAALVYGMFAVGGVGYVVAQLAVLLLIVVIAVGRAFWAVARTRPAAIGGLPLSEEDQPELWTEVREIAALAATRPPGEIRLVPEVNAFVEERPRLLGLLPGPRTLAVGVPLMMGLTRSQLRSVLGHELGHYSRHHTRLAPVVYRGQVTIAHLAHSLGHHNAMGRIFARYGRLYARVAAGTNRRQELEADLVGAQAGGRDAAVTALTGLPGLTSLWSHFLEDYAFAVPGARPEALFDGFGELVEDPRRREQLEEIRAEMPEPEPSPFDSHPPLRTRVEALQRRPDDGALVDPRPGVTVLREARQTLALLEAVSFEASEDVPRTWDWIAAEAGRTRARTSAALLVRARTEPGYGAATLHQALTALARGDSRRLVGPYVNREVPDDVVADVARSTVRGAVEAALIEHCGARHVVDWSRGRGLVDAQGVAVDVDDLVGSVIEQRSAEWLLHALADEGVPRGFTVDPDSVAELDEQPAEPQVRAVAVCSHWLRQRVVVVCDDGIVLKRLGTWEGLAATVRLVSLDRHRTALLHVGSLSVADLQRDRRARLHPWDSVDSVVLHGRRLMLTVAGRRTRLRLIRSAVSRDFVGALAVLLRERFRLIG